MTKLRLTRLALLVLLLSGGSSAIAQQTSVPEPQPECKYRLENVPGAWTDAEEWAWNERFCIGWSEADFSSINEGNCQATEISSTFVRRLLTYKPLNDILDFYSTSAIILKCAKLQGRLDLEEIRSDARLEFKKFLFPKGIAANRISLHDLVVTDSVVQGSIDALGAQVGGRISVRNTEITGNINLFGTMVSNYVDLSMRRIHGYINLRDARVDNHVHLTCNNADTVESDGTGFDVSSAIIGGRLQISGCNITGNISAGDANIRELKLFDSKIAGHLRMQNLHLAGKADLKNVTVSGRVDALGSDIGGHFFVFECEVTGIGTSPSENAALEFTGAKVHGGVSLSGCEIEGDVRAIGAKLGNLSIWGGTAIAGDLITRHMAVRSVYLRNITVNGRVDALRSDIADRLDVIECRVSGTGKSRSENAAFDFSAAKVGGDVLLSGCKIEGNVQAIGAQLGKLSIQGTTIDGDLVVRRMAVRSEVVLSDGKEKVIVNKVDGQSITVGEGFQIGTAGWGTLDLSESEVEERLKFEKCLDDQQMRRLILRDAQTGAIEDKGREKFGDCTWTNLQTDFIGWKYDGAPLQSISDRSAVWLVGWLSPTSGNLDHVAQPYVQLADTLAELGMEKTANEIRILEREKNLAQLKGLEGFWQWIILTTTRFGYEPVRALWFLFGLVLFGTALVWLADCKKGAEWREKHPRWFRGILTVLIVPGGGGVLYLVMEGGNVNWVLAGYGLLLVLAFVFGVFSFGAREMALRGDLGPDVQQNEEDNSRRATWGALLYSIDRTVPFLSFDSEHVSWFKTNRRLNDIPVLCIYFYFHSILGLALTSLFIAGLTGVLK